MGEIIVNSILGIGFLVIIIGLICVIVSNIIEG